MHLLSDLLQNDCCETARANKVKHIATSMQVHPHRPKDPLGDVLETTFIAAMRRAERLVGE